MTMRFAVLAGLAAAALAIGFAVSQLLPRADSGAAAAAHPFPVDLERYAGVWFQIVEAPSPNEWLFAVAEGIRGACVETIVEYAPIQGGIRLRNTCKLSDGRVVAIEGTAVAVDADNTVFEIVFDPWYLSLFRFDYRILYVDPDYRVAVLTSKNSNGISILSRTPDIERTLLPSKYLNIFHDTEK